MEENIFELQEQKHIYYEKKKHIHIRLQSGEIKIFPIFCVATLGVISNIIFNNFKLTKAGDNRHLGFKSIVRGVAMNPIDHPHGGDTSGGRPSVNYWGRYTKGIPSRKKSKYNRFILIKRN